VPVPAALHHTENVPNNVATRRGNCGNGVRVLQVVAKLSLGKSVRLVVSIETFCFHSQERVNIRSSRPPVRNAM
jgi:hypothetical protein